MSGWLEYWDILRRRWIVVAVILAVDIVAALYLYRREQRQLGYQACLTVYVADVSSPSLIAAPQTTLQTAGQLLAGETAANFFADDILDVGQSSRVAGFIATRLQERGLPNSSAADINGNVSGARKDRTVNLCVTNPNARTGLAAAQELGYAVTAARSRFVGKQMAKRTFVTVVSTAGVAPAPASSAKRNLALRVALGLLLALGVALLWDALDPTVRDRRDIEAALSLPVMARYS